MYIVSKTLTHHGIDSVNTYTFNTGHEALVWRSGAVSVFTPKGNYASQVTMKKVIAVIRQSLTQEV